MLTYADVAASAVILHNVVDMTAVIRQLIAEGVTITPDDVATLSPYLTRHIRRFGDYTIVPNGDTQPLNAALAWAWAQGADTAKTTGTTTTHNSTDPNSVAESTR